ncbi:steroid 17-alpha-hydroxylase/17,20 lyase-like [Dendronephthya gigantea]|uniref:steroid 17-alpha-hydroxylase/17,20 lyase-like n=1 Tax=Dendronephthya gigantea TaxID=151771 RepID=UPI00106955F9|nr:steroid 17-alpha-hydroxylase/17,20 lyase-like [Dendronephthya gigantea]XP_028405605.1 steroid 17-alpha-hydroxylase/17,20 lyase-like [Dendronephthya gigantea]
MIIEIGMSLFLSWVLWFLISNYFRRRRMPPGPFPLPGIGNALSVGHEPPFSMDHLRKKYGDIYTITFPIGTFVIVNRGEFLLEALSSKKDDYAGRPDAAFFPINSIFEGKDILFADYEPPLIFRRKVVSSALHMFGKGIENVERRVSGEVDRLISWIIAKNEEAFPPQGQITFTIMNNISEWLLSKRYDFNEPIVRKLFDFNDKLLLVSRQGSYYQFLPFMKYLPTKFMEDCREVIQTREEFFTSHFSYHRDTYNASVIRDITDALIAAYETEKEKDRGKDFGKIEDIKFLMMDILLATTDTTSSILTWFILFMILHEDIQDKVYKELLDVVGEDRSPCWNDMPNLHYLKSTICEVMRLSAFGPLNVPHKAIRDSMINGYHIPKGTTVIFNFWRIHIDPRDWKNPSVFDPNRFLDENAKFLGWDALKCFRPFGEGRRMCLGHALGKMQLLIVAAKICHNFKLKIPEGQPRPSIEGTMTAVRYPKKYEVVAVKRL